MKEKQSTPFGTAFSIGFIAVAAVSLGLWAQMHNRPAHAIPVPTLKNGTLLANNNPMVQPFDLNTSNNEHLTNAKLQQHWSLLFFGFTHCPQVCPTSLAEIKKANQLLAKNGQAVPTVYFITVDPNRDTPEALKTYLAHFDPDFIGATGAPDAIAAMAKNFGVAYAATSDNHSPNYTINHSGSAMLINPKGQWLAVLQSPLEAKNLARDIEVSEKYYAANNPT